MKISKNSKNSLLLFCMVILINSCKKDIVDVNPDYQGEWHSAPVSLDYGVEIETYFIIDGDKGVYGEWCDLVPLGSNCSSYFSGEVKINRNKSKLFIGNKSLGGNGEIVADIGVPPHLNDDGDWECTLTDRVYVKK